MRTLPFQRGVRAGLFFLSVPLILFLQACSGGAGTSAPSAAGGEGYGGGGPAEAAIESSVKALRLRHDRLHGGQVNVSGLCGKCRVSDGSSACERLEEPDPVLTATARSLIATLRDPVHAYLHAEIRWEEPSSLFEVTDEKLLHRGKEVLALVVLPAPPGAVPAGPCSGGTGPRICFNRAAVLYASADKLRQVLYHEFGHLVNYPAPLGGETRPLKDEDTFAGTSGAPFDGEQLLYQASACVERISDDSIAVTADNRHVQQTITCNGYTKIQWTAKSGDAGNRFDTATSRFTPGSGRWLLNAAVSYAEVPEESARLTLSVFRNGVLLRSGPPSVNHKWGHGAALTYVVDAKDGDYFELYARKSNCEASTLLSGDPTETWFQALPLSDASPAASAAGAGEGFLGQEIGCNVDTKLAFPNSATDPRTLLSADRSRFTPGGGRWLLNATTSFAETAALNSALRLKVFKNGTVLRMGAIGRNAGQTQGASLTYTVDAAPGDYFEIYAHYANCSGSRRLRGEPTQTWFQAVPLSSTGPSMVMSRGNVTQPLVCSSANRIDLGVTSGDPGGLYDPSLSRLTPGPGRWHLVATLGFPSDAPALAGVHLTLLKNGAPLKSAPPSHHGSYPQGVALSYVVESQEGDTFELLAFYSHCSAEGTLSGAPLETWLQATKW